MLKLDLQRELNENPISMYFNIYLKILVRSGFFFYRTVLDSFQFISDQIDIHKIDVDIK